MKSRSIPTEDEMRAEFDAYEARRAKYDDVLEANGKPRRLAWGTDEERFDIWCRRYTRPAPPTGLSIPNIKS